MKNVYIYCEGQTEEAFVNEVLASYFINVDIFVQPIICTTKRTQNKKYNGGVSNYNKIKDELAIICKQHKHEFVTTMFDYYAMPNNTPMIDCNELDIYKRIDVIEHAINSDINQPNCMFNLVLHEFEGLLYSWPQSFKLIADSLSVQQIQEVRDINVSPEHINNSYETAPSRRLEKLIPNYAKVRNGVIISKDIGIDRIMSECKHFASWIDKIKAL